MRAVTDIVSLFIAATFFGIAALTASSAYGFQSDDLAVSFLQSPVEIQLTDGGVAKGTISAINEIGIELLADATLIQLSMEQVASVTFVSPTAEVESTAVENAKGAVTFVDGSRANIGELQIIGDNATVLTVAGISIEASVSNLKTISFLGDEATESEKTQWTDLLNQTLPTSDAIVVSKNGTLQLIEGVVGDIDDQRLTFSMETRTAEVGLEKIEGVLFYRAQRELNKPLFRLTLTDSSSFFVRGIGIEGGELSITSVDGTQFNAAVDRLRRLDFSAGRFVYLSDLIPSTNTWTPLLASPEILESLKTLRMAKFNHDYHGQQLTLKTVPETGLSYLSETMAFDKGIAISGGGRVVFSVNRQFKRLTGLVGFDPEAYIGGEVRFVIKTDGQTAISEVMRADEVLQPITLDLDIAETDRISISVEYEDGKLAGDVLHLVDLKVLR